ncbi:hypothetical protein HID58_001005 [Brassica napus]|uniref:Uncharacterized protein n=2 Tax=Brassica napus TaxID=3708 RepID=A0ABQ8EI87_BRANA|nr:hypothetical protein HID58_001005 [Brassica napus]
METESSQYALALSSSSSSLPPHYQNPESCIGSFINLASSYRSFLRHLNPHGLALGLQNVICYGTDNKNDNGVPPYVVFKKTQIKIYMSFLMCVNKIIVTLPSSFKHYGYGCLAREATLSKRSSHATSPPLPFIFSSCNHNGAKRRQKILHILMLPQLMDHPVKYYKLLYHNILVQIYVILGICLVVNTLIIKLLLHTLPPPSSCLLLKIDEGLDLEELTNNFKQYELWGGPQENNNLDDVNTIDGSSYVISRSPFDPIGRPCNPFGPIERPLPHLPSSCELADLGFVKH